MLQRGIATLGIICLSGCGGIGSLSIGSINPFSVGSADNTDQEAVQPVTEFDDTPTYVATALPPEYRPVEEISRLWLDYSPRGIIVRADTVTDGLGYHSPVLFAPQKGRPDASGDVEFEFFAIPPSAPIPAASASARTLSAGAFLPNSRLPGIRSVTVGSAGNERTVRLR